MLIYYIYYRHTDTTGRHFCFSKHTRKHVLEQSVRASEMSASNITYRSNLGYHLGHPFGWFPHIHRESYRYFLLVSPCMHMYAFWNMYIHISYHIYIYPNIYIYISYIYIYMLYVQYMECANPNITSHQPTIWVWFIPPICYKIPSPGLCWCLASESLRWGFSSTTASVGRWKLWVTAYMNIYNHMCVYIYIVVYIYIQSYESYVYIYIYMYCYEYKRTYRHI